MDKLDFEKYLSLLQDTPLDTAGKDSPETPVQDEQPSLSERLQNYLSILDL